MAHSSINVHSVRAVSITEPKVIGALGPDPFITQDIEIVQTDGSTVGITLFLGRSLPENPLPATGRAY